MKKAAASPLRIPVKNSPRKMFSDMITNNGDANHSLEINARDYCFTTMRPPLCPIPEGSFNLPGGTNAEHDLITPGPKLDSTTHFAQMKLSGPGSAHGFSQSGDNMFRGLNCGTPDSELLNSSTGFSYTKNRFGWQEPRSHSSSATEMDFSKHSTGLTKYPSQGSLHEMGLSCEPIAFSMVGSSDNVSATPNGVARSLKYNQSVTASTGSLAALPSAESQNVAPLKSLQLESKNNFVQHHFELQEDPSFWDDHNVQVVIRIRPLSGIEVASQGHSRCVRQDSSHTLTWLGNPESRFTFDLVAGEKITQDKLFRVAGLPMVENCMRGYNSCMFAYGQTGSGKTHTMLGDIEDAEQKLSANRGMTPRVFEHLFTRIHKEQDTRREEKLKFVCKCSFLEIYNEQVADLLEPSSTSLQMREDAKKGVYVENLSEIEVKGVNDVIKLLLQGAANRKVAATNMNRASSRSHSVFTCIIESKWECQSVTHHRFGRLNLVDLAGSERQKSSGAEGERLKEATNINKSLSTLGLVIMNLVNIANGKAQHVPYRDSKLTFLLQDSLGGNSKTIIIANVSPSNCCGMETLSTLKFAQRAKFIRNNATVNENATGDVITLKMQIQQLKEEVSRLRGKHKGDAEHLQEEDYGNMNLLSSPGAYACGVASPLLSYKKAPRKRDLESALVGALKRERAIEMQMKAMAAENEQLKCLVKQREEDAQCGKMMLRFREDRIKRLEAVASDKMSAEAHLLEEKTVLMEELQILRNRLDRNPEVTRFAMENIRLMEQLRRFQELYEGGEHEQMVEQIAVLRDQLLEALDWKLMHELDPNLANQKEPSETESFSEESEYLQKQVDQHRREADALRSNLSFCLEAKEKLERRVDDLMMQIEKMRVSNNTGAVEMATATEVNYSEEVEAGVEGLSAQRELKDLVEAISVASQREAEAQGNAIFLATEVKDLRKKLRESADDNKRLIDMFEKVIQERDEIQKAEEDSREVQEKLQEQVLLLRNQVEELQKEIHGQSHTFRKYDYTNNWPEGVNVVNAEEEQMVVLMKEVDDLRLKLHDTSEENEQLLELYEKAMQEKDEIRKAEKDSREVQIKLQEQVLLLRNQVEKLEKEIDTQSTTLKDNCTDNVVSAEEEQTTVLRKEVEVLQLKLHDTSEENDRLLELYEKAMQDRDDIRKMWWDSVENVADIEAAHGGPRSPETLIVGNDKEKIQEYMSAKRDDKAEKEVIRLRNEVEEIQMKLKDLHEENERLIDMYEKAMEEKDEIRKLWNENVKNNVSSELIASTKNEIESQDLINEVEQQRPELQESDKGHDFQEETMENGIEYQKLTRKSDEHEEESTGLQGLDTEEIQNKEYSFASCTDSGHIEQNIEFHKQEMINDFKNLQTELGRMVQENEKLVKMYEKATQERNELAKQWQKAAESLKHDNIAKNIQMVTGNPTCFMFPDESKLQPEAKGSVYCSTEQVDFGENMDENTDSPGIFCFLMKEVDELQSKMKEMAEEYENLTLQKTVQESEHFQEERTLFFKEIGDLKLKLKALSGGNEDMVEMNQRHVQVFQGTENPAYNFDAHFDQEKGDLELKSLEELQPLSSGKEMATSLTNNRERIVMDSTINIHNSGAFIISSSSQNEEKLKVLQEQEQQVQNKFEEMDVKLGFFGESMDNLNMIKDKLEADLELVCDQATELASSIAEKETRLQTMQLEQEQLVRRLQESEQYREELAHFSNVEKAEVQRGKDPMIESMANREKILLQELTLARSKLVVVQKRIEEITQLVDGLSVLERSYNEMQNNRKLSEALKKEITYKKEQIDALQTCSNEMQTKRVRTFSKLSALKSLLSDLSASEEYWKSRESRANEKVETFTCLMNEKMEELTDLQTTKKALEAAIEQTIEMEATAQAEVCELKDKLKLAEQQRVDAEKMVVQLDKQAVLCSDLRSSAEHTPMQFVKAASLLKGEEERIKLFNSLKELTEQVNEHRENIKKLEGKLDLVDSSIQQVQSKVNAESAAVKEAELVLERILYEKQMLIESQEEARLELDILILELQSSEFEVQSKECELNDRREDLQDLHNRLCELQNKDKINQELEPEHCFITQQVLAKLQDVHGFVREADASLDSLKLHELKQLEIIDEK